MKSNSILSASFGAALAIGAAATASADTYTWLASPASATWNTSALNWSDGTTSGVAWVNGNDAVFPATSSQKKISISGNPAANNVTINGAGYNFSGKMLISGKITVNQGTTLEVGFLGDSVRIGGPSTATAYMGWGNNPAVKTVTLEDTIVIAPNDRRCLGPDPAAPTTNVVVSGSGPSLFANGNIDLGENRIIRIMTGNALFLGAAPGKTLTIGNIFADASSGLDFNNDALVRMPSYWSGAVVLAQPANATNAIGRLVVQNNAKFISGTTRLGSGTDFGTGDNALMHVQGSGTFAEARRLVVDNATLYASQSSRYIDVNSYGWVVVTNGGKIDMPNAQWLNGHGSPGRLDVVDGGELRVAYLRLSQSGTSNASQINLNEGGTIAPAALHMDAASKAVFTFDGGTFLSRATGDGRTLFQGATAKWANVTFAVGEKGAVFDATGQNIWWDKPLTSGVSGGTDGGIRKFGSGNLILRAANTYSGPTVIESGWLNARADFAIPDGSVLRLGGGDSTAVFDPYLYEGSPARPTTNWLASVEGNGDINNCSALHVTNSIAPNIDSTIGFAKVCDLRGDYVISANATNCSCIYLAAAGQDISGLKLTLTNPGDFDKDKRDGYRIVRAPNGYDGAFDESALPSGWLVEYNDNSIYLKFPQPFVMIVR